MATEFIQYEMGYNQKMQGRVARDQGFDVRSAQFLLFFLSLFQEGQLTMAGEIMRT